MTGTLRALAAVSVALAALCSCADIAKRREAAEAREREQFLHYAGPPVDSFRYLGHYRRWQQLGDGQVAVWSDVNDVHLLKLEQPCPGLEFTDDLRVSSYAQLVTRGIDSVHVRQQECRITEIRPVDYLRMKQELHLVQ